MPVAAPTQYNGPIVPPTAQQVANTSQNGGADPSRVTGNGTWGADQPPGAQGPQGPYAPPLQASGQSSAPSYWGQPPAPPAPPKPAPPTAADLATWQAAQMQTPEFMTPAMQQYVDQFHTSQANMQQSLNSGLAQALTGLKSRRDAAANVVATLPGQYQAAYQQAAGTAGRSAQQAANAFHGPTIGGNNPVNDIAAANAGAVAAGKSSVPLLQAGITADYSKGATTLENTHMQNEAQWNDANTQFAGQMAHDQAQFDQATAAQKQSIAADIYRTELQSSLDLKNKEAEYEFERTHPQALTAGERANISQGQNAQANAAGYTDYASMQNARSEAQKIGQGLTSKGNTLDAKNVKAVVEHDPNLKVAMQEQGYLTIDKATGIITWLV